MNINETAEDVQKRDAYIQHTMACGACFTAHCAEGRQLFNALWCELARGTWEAKTGGLRAHVRRENDACWVWRIETFSRVLAGFYANGRRLGDASGVAPTLQSAKDAACAAMATAIA